MQETRKRLPAWLKRTLPTLSAEKTHGVLSKYKLNTVCESALCPNRSECYARNTATFMILGDVCTRSCGFCAIEAGQPLKVEADEPDRVANAAKELGLEYVVITSVARDELPDEGAGHFADTIQAVYREIPDVQVEVLTPDFHAREELIAKVLSAKPTVYNHNMESVERLQNVLRPQGSYSRTLKVVETIKKLSPETVTKSGLMLGLGEAKEEVHQTAKDLASAGCEILTLGQYLPPSRDHLTLKEYVSPEVFAEYRSDLMQYGFKEIFSGPYVRSSYHAGETFLNAQESNSVISAVNVIPLQG